jgi:hypothetical protein
MKKTIHFTKEGGPNKFGFKINSSQQKLNIILSGWGYDKSYMGPVAVWNANTGVQTGDVKWKTEQEFDNTSTDSAGYQVQLMRDNLFYLY